MAGDGVGENGCSTEGWSVHMNLYLPENAAVLLERDGDGISAVHKLVNWDVYQDQFITLLFPEGYATGGANTPNAGRRALPDGFITSAFHEVADISSVMDGYVLLGAPAGTKYMLTLDAIFATEAAAKAARKELLSNLAGNHSFSGQPAPSYPWAFGVNLSPDQYPQEPRVYRW
eukprot:3004795-Rhodomonas_salina.1